MCDKHWTDEEMLLKLFDEGLASEHLEMCPVCRPRWKDIQRRYANRPLSLPDVPEDKLIAQRRTIRARLESRNRKFHAIFVPSLVTSAVLLALAAIVFWPASTRLPKVHDLSGDSALEEIFTSALSTEPEAIKPILLLFEEEP